MGQWISVGEPFPLFENSRHRIIGKDGGVFEALEDKDGFIYSMYLNHPLSQEIESVRHKEIKVKLIEDAPFCLPLIRFGNTKLIFEMSFDPTLYGDKRAFQIKESNNILNIFLIDSATNKVEAIRSANFPLQFIKRCVGNWEQAFSYPNYSSEYKRWFQDKQSIPLDVLWEYGLYLGKMGESFNLDELNY